MTANELRMPEEQEAGAETVMRVIHVVHTALPDTPSQFRRKFEARETNRKNAQSPTSRISHEYFPHPNRFLINNGASVGVTSLLRIFTNRLKFMSACFIPVPLPGFLSTHSQKMGCGISLEEPHQELRPIHSHKGNGQDGWQSAERCSRQGQLSLSRQWQLLLGSSEIGGNVKL